jgi:hypothetical protein
MEVLRILGVTGSLRRGSYNRALLRAAQELLPEGMTLELFDLRDIPPYDMDVEQQGLPMPVVAWKEAIRRADALLIATPEHNWSVPGVCRPDVRVFQWPGSVFGARCSALGVDPVPGIGSQVPGIRDLRPGTRTESRCRKGRSGYRWDSRFMPRKTRTRGMQAYRCPHTGGTPPVRGPGPGTGARPHRRRRGSKRPDGPRWE